MIVADVATDKRETTDTVHVIAEEPDRAYAPSVCQGKSKESYGSIQDAEIRNPGIHKLATGDLPESESDA